MNSAGLWASVAGGYLSDRFGKIPVIIIATLISAGTIYLLNLASFGVGLGALLLIMGICNFIRMPAAEAYIMSQTTEHNRSTIYGIYYCSMTETGALLAPIMGYIIDRFGFYTSFTITSVAAVAVILICSMFLGIRQDAD